MARDNQDLTKLAFGQEDFIFQCTTYCIESFGRCFLMWRILPLSGVLRGHQPWDQLDRQRFL